LKIDLWGIAAQQTRGGPEKFDGVALRAGLLAELKPQRGSSPVRAAIPDAQRGVVRKGEGPCLPRSGDGSNTDGRSGGVGKPTPALILAEEVNAYYEAQRRATRARLR
jgi:hypothetical protein